MKATYLCLFGLLFLLLGCPFCKGQVVTVRVVNVSHVRPLPDQQVSVTLLYGSHRPASQRSDKVLQLKTDVNGKARFKLPLPPPPDLSVQVHLSSGPWRCGCLALVSVRKVVRKGFIQAKPVKISKNLPPSVKVKPAEILFVAQRLSLFERLLYPFVKE